MGLLIIYAVVSIAFSFLCSILEAVLLSVTPSFLNSAVREKRSYAPALQQMKQDVDKPLIAILTLNTIAHTVGAILVGVQAENMVSNGYRESVYGIPLVGVVSGIMTVLILVVSEIIPKTIGATYWKRLAGFSVKALQAIIWPLRVTGILWLLQLTTRAIGKSAHVSTMSREEFIAIANTASEEGVFHSAEGKFIKNLMKFSKVQVANIMTPRSVMVMAPEKQTVTEFFKQQQDLRFSRIPVYGANAEDVTGYVLKDMILADLVNDKPLETLAEIKREITVVNRDIALTALFDTLMKKQEHIALVVDEYGSTVGLVTMEDVVETLLGVELVDEMDRVEDMQALARKNWESRAKRLGIINEVKAAKATQPLPRTDA